MSEEQNKEKKNPPENSTDKPQPEENLKENTGHDTEKDTESNFSKEIDPDTHIEETGNKDENEKQNTELYEKPQIKDFVKNKPENITPSEEKEKQAPGKNIKRKPAESNYQVSLVNENLLRVKINTEREINIEFKSGSEENRKITIPQSKGRKKKEIDLVISINPEYSAEPQEETADVLSGADEEKKPFFTPNPEVVTLIRKGSDENANANDEKPDSEKTEDEILYEKLEKKNPYKLFRKAYKRNLTQAVAGAIVIYLVAVALFSSYAAKQTTPHVEPDSQRIVIIQDMPEPKINLENVEDPNAPPPEEETETEGDGIIPRKIPRTTSPRVYRPRTENNTPTTNNEDTSASRLDSLRNLVDTNNTGKDTNTANNNNNNIPDSLRATYSPGDVPIAMDYPKNWKILDNRTIENVPVFTGVIITDTTAAQGTLMISMFLDKEGKKLTDDFTKPFPMNDTSMTAYQVDPKTIAGITEYRFYVFGKTDKMYIEAKVKKDDFERYKPQIEAAIRSIKLKPPGT